MIEQLVSTMGSATHANSLARRTGPAFLGSVLAAAIFAWGVVSGSVPIPARYQAADVSLKHHPYWFCLLEAFWLVTALAAGWHGVRVRRRLRRGPHSPLRPRHDGLPESLSELVCDQRVSIESVPRLLAELRPSLRQSDYYPMLHHRKFEWLGVLGALIFVGGMFLTLALVPELSRVFIVAMFGLAAIATVTVTFAIPAGMRKRRRQQMERIFAAETFHAEAVTAPLPPRPRRVPRPEPIDAEGCELRCTSPNGRYVIYVHAHEMPMGQWAFTPQMVDSTTRRVLFHPRAQGWSLDSAVWHTTSLVAMALRRYPGDQAPIAATFDCASGVAHIDGIAVEPFTDSEAIERALAEACEACGAVGATRPGSQEA
jgi:hypothetical protein